MNFLWFCAAGYSLFVGIALLALAIILSALGRKLWRNLIIYTLAIVAAFLIFLSATPFPSWFYILWAAAVIVWLLFVTLQMKRSGKLQTISSITAMSLGIIALLVELPFHLSPSLPEGKFETLYVIGDSISAGIGGKEEQTWPKILRDNYGINVIDLSQAGATAASAMRQAVRVDSENAIVLLEIGGNDLFAPTHPALFEKQMEQLLRSVTDSKRAVVILELPLQPWHISYGRIQRQLAKQFNAVLIPRRFLVSVLSAEGASADLAHLSATGHRLMAEKIRSLLGYSLVQTNQDNRD